MTFNLQMLNLWIGLCRKAHGLPSSIHDAGFREQAIELDFSVAPQVIVNPELAACSEPLDHCLLFEWKSGANIDCAQVNRYAQVTHDSLFKAAKLPRSGTQNHDICYVGDEAHVDRLKTGISQCSATFPLLVKDSSGLTRVENTFGCERLNNIFAPTLEIDWEIAPRDYVPLDGESTDVEFAEACMPEVFLMLEERVPSFDIITLAQRMFKNWQFMRQRGRDAIIAKLKAVLQAACSNHYFNFLQPNTAGHYERIRVVANPFLSGSDRKAWKHLGEMQEGFLRMLSGQPEGQLSLFPDYR